MRRTQVLVITKAPVPGRSKTRLTPPCTPEQAAGIAAASVGDTLDAVRAAPVGDRRFGYPLEMVTRAADAGWRVHEVDVDYGLRTAGTRSKVTGTVLGTVRTVRDMRGVLAR